MLHQNDIDTITDRDVYGSDGEKIGAARQVYADDTTGKPAWVTVRTGLFGTNETFLPLAEATLVSDGIAVPYSRAFVKNAPNVHEDGHLTPEQERELYAYYRRDDADRDDYPTRDASQSAAAGTRRGGEGDPHTTTDDDVSVPRTDDAMTVSEEQLNVGTEEQEAGRVRLKKYVVTENVTKTVPLRREEVRLEREPITGDGREDRSGSDLSEEEHEVVLHEDRPVVEKDTVPVERIRLDTDTVTEQETVSQDVRRERVDVEGDVRT
jgi:uncharacterized protein (TIGR02271 family)